MEKKVILLDIDDTINQFNTAFWALHEEVYDEKIDPETVNTWDLANFSSQGNHVYGLFKHPGLFRYIEPKNGAVEFVEQLNEKYDVYFVTDSPPGTSHCDGDVPYANQADDKRKWVREHFPFIDKSKIIICANKWMILGDVLIDDKPDTFYAFQKRKRNIILMDAPHNRSIETPFRARNFEEAHALVEQLLHGKKSHV